MTTNPSPPPKVAWTAGVGALLLVVGICWAVFAMGPSQQVSELTSTPDGRQDLAVSATLMILGIGLAALAAVFHRRAPEGQRSIPAADVPAEGGTDGWHDEGGALVLAAGGIGWVWLYSTTDDVVPGAILFTLGAVVAIGIWRAGYREGQRKAALRGSAGPDGAEDG